MLLQHAIVTMLNCEVSARVILLAYTCIDFVGGLSALQNVKGDTDNLSKELAKVQALANSLEYRNNDLENQQCDSEGQIEELTTEIGRRTERLAALEKSSLRLQKNVDEQHQELIDLREALELKSAEIIRLRDLKDDVLQQAENLRDDLLQVRGEAAQLAHDLHSFKEQQQLQQSTARSSDREADKLREELMARTKQLAKLTAKQENHVCTVYVGPMKQVYSRVCLAADREWFSFV